MAKKPPPPSEDEIQRALAGEALPGDDQLDRRLRPESFGDFVGQDDLKRNLQLYIQAARARKEPLDHVLLSGPPGLGKTTLAGIIAREMGAGFRSTSGPALERPADLVGLLTGLEPGDVLFIDEIHRIGTVVEEYLYSAMDDFKIDVVIDKGPGARAIKIDLKPFTLVAATTREGLLTGPFRSRFGIPEKLAYYGPEDLVRIVRRSAGILGIEVDDAGAMELARRARGTPRVANRFLKRVRDVAEVRRAGTVTAEIAGEGLAMLGVDERGLDRMDRQILDALRKHGGGPIGLKTIAVTVGEEEDTIEEVYEPFLIQGGYVQKTPKGRRLGPAGYQVLGVKPPKEEPGLF
ncbi:MAG TPA: Holliday junction branch migration DNA helicase RuvB [Planctomycetota bacterium]|nr:Holliday junction branch migration DNA helicase RuvB [Planctomycetota bacterium]